MKADNSSAMTAGLASGALVFDQVSKQYGSVTAVDNVSFSIPKGDLVTLLGPSGCGKTSTLRLIAGLEHVSRGRILIGGQDVTRQSAIERNVSMVFQSYALFPHMTVQENVAYGLEVGGARKTEAKERAIEGLRLVGLADFGPRLPSELSGGQQQRVAVARALVLEPQVLLLDEPLSNLDTKLRRRVRDEIREIQQRLRLTAVYVTHDQEEALAVSDQIIVMNKQKVAQQGSPRDLFETPADEFVADFICDANLVAGELQGEACEIGGIKLQLANPRRYRGAVRVAVRPDAMRLRPAAANDPLVGAVLHAAFLGTEMQYTLASPLGELFVRQAEVRRPLAVGSSVAIDFADHGLCVVGGQA
ncbi:ABC transporter ATP-binding protein [Paucibacter sediminis]|uniref:ABC transporter ATP-binding protein n=1 Tax=Paucibacter sediminis TaxID=3019553 RepID=A0AA95NKH0_9BURK|nr:ABC transporter ATP-binding protein [Paucibacter sp. S2-9]WIT14163.1 ABC transporter ATP-binding protein [Paucibacter sp. S2-9]